MPTVEESKNKYLEYLEGHISNVKEAFDLLCTLNIPFIDDNQEKLRSIIEEHDKSKYDEPEWTAYLHHFYPTCDEDSLKTEEFEEACRHHIQNNPHHWDYWLVDGNLREDIDELEYKLYTVERLCDHMAMSIQNDNKPDEWYFANKEHIIMPDYGYEFYEEMLNAIPKDYDLSFHGTRNDGEPERDAINEDAIDDYIKSLEIDETSIMNNYDTQISNHYKYIRQVGRKINNAKYDDERNNLKKKQDFYKEVYKRLKSLKEDIGLNDKVIKSLGKRAKLSKTSNAVEIDTQMTNRDIQLKESTSNVYGYRSIGVEEFEKLIAGETINGRFNNSSEIQNSSEADSIVSFYTEPYKWKDKRHVFFIKCKFNESDIIDTGSGKYYASKDFAKTKQWTGRRGNVKYELNEFYVNSYDISNVVAFDYNTLSHYNTLYKQQYENILKQEYISELNEEAKMTSDAIADEYVGGDGSYIIELKDGWTTPSGESYIYAKNKREARLILKQCTKRLNNKEQLIKFVKEANKDDLLELDYWFRNAGYYQDDKRKSKRAFILSCIENNYTDEPNNRYQKTQNKELENLVCNALRKDGEEYLDKTVLTEMKASQIKSKSKNEDPERINRSKKVKTTYLGMSKFGILNFKTTSQSRNGHHYQTVEFKDMAYFENIVKEGRAINPQDVKKAIQEQDINVFCTDESFTYWAWAHSAYKNDFLYIDDRIPDLKKRIQAPKVNNVRLNGGSCKHILSVIDYMTRPFVILAISDDMNAYLGNQVTKMDKQTTGTQNQYDQVAKWDWSTIEDYTGLSKIQIMSDISKTLQIVPSVDKGEVIEDMVNEALPNEDAGLKRQIVDIIEQELENNETTK